MNRGLFCLDWKDSFLLYGEAIDDSAQMMEFYLLPCNYVHSYMGYTGDSISKECVADQEKQQEYLGKLQVFMYFND